MPTRQIIRAAQAVSDYWFEALACEDCEDADGWCDKHFEMCQPTMEALRSALASATRGSASLPNPDPVESDRQSSKSRGLETASAVSVEEILRLREANIALMRINGVLRGRASGEDDHWCAVEGCKQTPTFYAFESDEFVCDAHIYYGADNPWRSEYVPRDLIVSAIADLSHPKPSVDSALTLLREAIDPASTRTALPPPESGSSGLGSASALEVEAGDFYLVSDPEHSGPREDWYCGCPILRSPFADFCPVCRVAAPWLTWARSSASATKPEASPSPEKSLKLGDERSSSCGVALIAAERTRQVESEGWTPDHDAAHTGQQLARAASIYAMPKEFRAVTHLPSGQWLGTGWPWDPEWYKPSTDRVRELVKAGALCAAEIDRLTRTSTTANFVRVPDPKSPSSRPVSTDEEEGQGLEDGGLQSRPSGGDS